MVKASFSNSDTLGMDNTSRWFDRLTHSSHLLTVMTLTAVTVVFLIPFSGHPAAHRAVAPIHTRHATAVPTPTTTTTATAPTTTTTSPPPVAPPTTVPAPAPAPATPPAAPARNVAAAVPSGYGCGPALAYLQAHAAPGFTFECPGSAQGHQAMTCDYVPGVCPGTKVIAIATPCPAAYMNEASNSWVIEGESHAPIDPYGYCH